MITLSTNKKNRFSLAILPIIAIVVTGCCAKASNPGVTPPANSVAENHMLLRLAGKISLLNLSTGRTQYFANGYQAAFDHIDGSLLVAVKAGDSTKLYLYDCSKESADLIGEDSVEGLVTQISVAGNAAHQFGITSLDTRINKSTEFLLAWSRSGNSGKDRAGFQISKIEILNETAKFVRNVCFASDSGGDFAANLILSDSGQRQYPELSTTQPTKSPSAFVIFSQGKVVRSWLEPVSFPKTDDFISFDYPISFCRGQIFVRALFGKNIDGFYLIDAQTGAMQLCNFIAEPRTARVAALSDKWDAAVVYRNSSSTDGLALLQHYDVEVNFKDGRRLHFTSFNKDTEVDAMFWNEMAIVTDGHTIWTMPLAGGTVSSKSIFSP
jgi:hypothetical protein